jgi:hypothetical protein
MKKISFFAKWKSRRHLVKSLEIALLQEEEKNKELTAKLVVAIDYKHQRFINGEGDIIRELNTLRERMGKIHLPKKEYEALDELCFGVRLAKKTNNLYPKRNPVKKLSVFAKWRASKDLIQSLEVALQREKEKKEELTKKLAITVDFKHPLFTGGEEDLTREINTLTKRIKIFGLSKEEKTAYDKLYYASVDYARGLPRCDI